MTDALNELSYRVVQKFGRSFEIQGPKNDVGHYDVIAECYDEKIAHQIADEWNKHNDACSEIPVIDEQTAERKFMHAFNGSYFRDGVKENGIAEGLKALMPYLKREQGKIPVIDAGTNYLDIRMELEKLSGIPAMAITANEHIQKIGKLLKREQGEISVNVQSQEMDILEWLKLHHPEVFREQKHLNAGTSERAYWHYGRWSALKDIQKLPKRESVDVWEVAAKMAEDDADSFYEYNPPISADACLKLLAMKLRAKRHADIVAQNLCSPGFPCNQCIASTKIEGQKL